MKTNKIKNLLEWIASRKLNSGNRSDHADELIWFAREVLENADNEEYWKEVYYSK